MSVGLWLFAVLAVSLVRNDDGSWRAPVNELGEPCRWPLEPALLLARPLGQYHCEYCGAMVLAGIGHLDYQN